MYFLFIVLWGINYNRVGLEESIKTEYKSSVNKKDISNIAFDKNDLEELYSYLIEKCNYFNINSNIKAINLLLFHSFEFLLLLYLTLDRHCSYSLILCSLYLRIFPKMMNNLLSRI